MLGLDITVTVASGKKKKAIPWSEVEKEMLSRSKDDNATLKLTVIMFEAMFLHLLYKEDKDVQ